MKRFVPALLLCTIATAASVAAAGTVNVTYAPPAPSKYSDAGTSQWDEEPNLKALAEHLQGLGALMPANHAIKIEFADMDLAGTVKPSRRDGSPFRTVKGQVDAPRATLRYTWEVDGKQRATGEELVTDLYYERGISKYHASKPLFYEKRMLEKWFKQRFGEFMKSGGAVAGTTKPAKPASS